MLGKKYSEISPVDASKCVLFELPKAVTLPRPRALLPHQVHEQNGRSAFYVEARITFGFWIWKRTVECVFIGAKQPFAGGAPVARQAELAFLRGLRNRLL
jgi:hypothetical protein